MFVHATTMGLTIGMQCVVDNYKQSATAADIFRLTIRLGYWRMMIKLDVMQDKLRDMLGGDTLANVYSGLHCCLGYEINIRGESAPRKTYIGEMTNEGCTKLRIMQSSSIIVIILAFG